jgi:hypothetical protein
MATRTLAAAGLALVAGALGLAAPAVAAPARLPLVVIDTERRIVDDPKVDATMRIAARGRIRFSSRIGIEIRGTSSMAYPKKQYAIEVRDRDGDGRDAAPLGLPAADDWVLQGPYGDKTLMRNALAYRIARSTGRYASRTRFVEAVVNDDYRGVFVLMEPPELGRRRVAGEHLLELTAPYKVTPGDAHFPSLTGQRLIHADPEPEEAGPGPTRRIRHHLRAFEAALHGPAFADPAAGWRAHLDEASAVDHVLLHELLKNQDAFHASLFVHKPARGRLRLGPAWDFDIAMGNSDFGESARVAGWMTAGRPWAGRLLQDPGFARALAARWRGLRAAGLREHALALVDANAGRLRGAQARNFERWPILGARVWPNPVDPATGAPPPDWPAEVAALRGWLEARIAWIDANVDGLAR